MNALIVDFLTNLATELSTELIPAPARRLRYLAGRCLGRRSATGGHFPRFLPSATIQPHSLILVRANKPDIDELAFLFHEAGYDAEILMGLVLCRRLYKSYRLRGVIVKRQVKFAEAIQIFFLTSTAFNTA